MIEYTVTSHDPVSGDIARTYHANREATFHGPHTGLGDGRQISGGAFSLWREDDAALLESFRRYYRGDRGRLLNITLDVAHPMGDL